MKFSKERICCNESKQNKVGLYEKGDKRELFLKMAKK